MRRRFATLLLLCLLAGMVGPLAHASQVDRRVYLTGRLDGEPPAIDGSLTESVWDSVDWAGDFLQRDPVDGQPPSKQTQFKMLYDDDAVYFAFRAFDDPEQCNRLLSRRDGFPGDWIEVNIDSHNDRRTAYSFTLSLSGVRGDEFISNDGNNWDPNWDPVWSGATQLDDEGWTGEARIPLSQLRFSGEAEQSWGLQVQRRIFRLEERSTWQRIPKDSTGWVSQFGEIRGLSSLKPSRRLELMPYAVARGESSRSDPGDPFFDGSASELDGGIDGKVGIGNALTLDFTVNPDFGQVEADPSQVNLTAFETFFSERRPFFIEGNHILSVPLAPAITGGSFTGDLLFYSRRIGRRPGLSPDADFVESPDNSTILGAFKLSGKTASGLSLALMNSVTDEERARTEIDGVRDRVTVEPLTNFFVGRLQQDFGAGNTQLGGMVTAVNRDLSGEAQLDFMRRQAYAGGLDFSTYFRNRDYRLEANLLASTIRGSREAILQAQNSSARYYQRPDNESASLDPTRTALGGNAGSARLTRTSNSKLQYQTGVAWRSPGFEINDLGFMRSADEINQFTWMGYNQRNPLGVFDRFGINGNLWLDWDHARNFLGARYNTNANANFRNKWYANYGVTRSEERTSNTALRGGPSSRWPGAWEFNVNAGTDARRDFFGSAGGYVSSSDSGSGGYNEVWASMTFRPTNALRLSFNPTISHNRPEMQYVSTQSFGGAERYLFGRLDQDTVRLTFRLDYTITPNLTVQYYGAPFISSGRYREFKRITDPRAAGYRDRFSLFDEQQLAYNPATDTFDVDEDRDGTVDYGIANPDFDVRDFNSNLVLRWEYSAGSTVFLVWSQAIDDNQLRGLDLSVDDDLDRLFSAHSDNVVLLKFSKWFTP